MKNKISEYKEVRCNFLNEEDGFWRVDAWKTDDDNEEGRTVALIDSTSDRVIYLDPVARYDSRVAEIIKEKSVKDVSIKDEAGTITQYFDTAAGKLVVQIEKEENTGSDNVYVGIRPIDHEDCYLDLVGVKIETDKEIIGEDPYAVKVYVYSDPSSEDPTNGLRVYGEVGETIYKNQIDEALEGFENE